MSTRPLSSPAAPMTYARLAGVLYLIIVVTGAFAEFFVRTGVRVPGDAAATVHNILAAETLFRSGIVADLVMILSDIAIGLALFVLLEPVSRTLSLLAAFLRLVQAAILGMNLLNLLTVVELLSGADYLAGLGTAQVQAQAMLAFAAHSTGYRLALVFFGASLLVQGYLVYRSGYLPRVLGLLLAVAGASYLADAGINFVLPAYYVTVQDVVTAVAFPVELAFALWLLVKGVNVHRLPWQRPDALLPAATQFPGVEYTTTLD